MLPHISNIRTSSNAVIIFTNQTLVYILHDFYHCIEIEKIHSHLLLIIGQPLKIISMHFVNYIPKAVSFASSLYIISQCLLRLSNHVTNIDYICQKYNPHFGDTFLPVVEFFLFYVTSYF